MQPLSELLGSVKTSLGDNSSTTQSPSTTLPPTSTDKERNRQAWFMRLLKELAAFRRVVIEPERAALILQRLHEDQYGERLATVARVWILYGDWRYKGADPTLELADFYPADDQQQFAVERLRAEGYIVMTPEQLKRHTDAARWQERASVEQRYTGFVPPEIKRVVDEVVKPENFDRSFDELGLS